MSDNLTAILRAMSEQEREPITRSQCQSLMAAADELDHLRAFVREVNEAQVVGWSGFAPFGLLSPTDRQIHRDEWAENGWVIVELIARPARMEV